jgi:hypothetical protein
MATRFSAIVAAIWLINSATVLAAIELAPTSAGSWIDSPYGTRSSTFRTGVDGLPNPDQRIRGYATFDLTGVGLPVISARFVLIGSPFFWDSFQNTETIGVFDVVTPSATLENNSLQDPSIYSDLGDGSLYGSGDFHRSPDPANPLIFIPQYIDVNPVGLAAINSRLGGQISFGYSHLSITGGANDIVGFQNRLELTTVPEPTSAVVLTTAAVVAIVRRRRWREAS